MFFSSRLSESIIWSLQKKAYSHFGIKSWTQIDNVPFHITSNSHISAQYAQIAQAASNNEPMTVLELGGGSGKFAYLFISELLKLNCALNYLCTDFAKKNVDFWNAHPLFIPWIKQGLFRTALYDPMQSSPLCYRPQFVIANYLFDSLPQDLFCIEKGRLLEGRINLQIDSPSLDDPEIISKIRDTYSFEPLEGSPYPHFPEAVAILEKYRRRFDNLTFFFPIGALTLICRLEELFGPKFLLLANDRGPCTEEQLCNEPPPHMSLHGGIFSFPVNFHAIRLFLEKKGGEAAFPTVSSSAFTAGLLSLQPLDSFLKQTIAEQRFGLLETQASNISEILNRLETANWDATLFFSFFDSIQRLFGQALFEEKQRLLAGMRQIRGRFFPLLREEAYLLESLGSFLQILGEKQEADQLFKSAQRFKTLPRQGAHPEIIAFLKEAPPAGDVLQIGGDDQVSAIIQAYHPKSCVSIPWKEALGNCDFRKSAHKSEIEKQGVLSKGSRDSKNEVCPSLFNEPLGFFDAIYLFPPRRRLFAQMKKPQLISEIEAQFPFLNTITYSDRDVDALFENLDPAKSEYLLPFFCELKRKKNITGEQFERVLNRLQAKNLDFDAEEDGLFEILHSLKKLLKPEGVLRCCLQDGISLYDDPSVFEEIIVNPYIHYEEKQDPASQAIWVAVRVF